MNSTAPRCAPTMMAVMGSFSNLARSRNWQDLEHFFNPAMAFERVHVVSMGDDHEYETTVFGTVTVHPIPTLAEGGRMRVLNNLYEMTRAVGRMIRIVREHPVDLVAQIYGGPLKFGLPAVVVARWADLPSVISLHNDYPRLMAWTYSPVLRWLAGFGWRFLFQRATRVRSVSRYIAGFAAEAGVPSERVAVIPNKEDLTKFQGAPSAEELDDIRVSLGLDDLPETAVVFLTVARLVPAKNLEGMLRAFASASSAREDLRYLIAGTGPLEPRLKRLAQELNVADRVRFLGFVPHQVLRGVYHLSDVFLFVTHYEGQPRALVEALLAGLPVVCADYGQVCEVVHPERDGLWAPPDDIDAISSAIVRMAADPATRRRMGIHPEFDPGRYSIAHVGSAEAALYLAVIDTVPSVQLSTAF